MLEGIELFYVIIVGVCEEIVFFMLERIFDVLKIGIVIEIVVDDVVLVWYLYVGYIII